jgi:antitoxin (DNA-binding transcriptional repressor) of toxin-antitoxin stability system
MDKDDHAAEDDARLSALVKQAQAGDTLTLTRDGKVVALITVDLPIEKADPLAAMERILAIGSTVSLDGDRFADLVVEGRKY